MNMLLRLAILFSIIAAAISPSHAQLQTAAPNVKAEIAIETQRPVPGGTATVAISMKPNAGWHDYWINPADAGTPLELEWDLPSGVQVGALRAPVPKTLMVGGFMNYVYERPHSFLIDLQLSNTIPIGTKLPIKVSAAWSACSDQICVPEKGDFTINLVTGNGTADAAINAVDRRRFDQLRQEIPPMIDAVGSYAIQDGKIEFAIPYPAAAPLNDPYFFPVAGDIIDHSAIQTARRTGDNIVITAPANTFLKNTPDEITGLIYTGKNQGLMVRLQAGGIPAGGKEIATLGGGNSSMDSGKLPALWLIILAAILGGLLLNLMPCVFPILGLKAISLAKMGGSERAARRDAWAYSAGVIFSCLALGVILLLLRAGGEQIGWAFQLQEPVIVLLLLLLMVAITANLAGIFEMNISTNSSGGSLGSFGTGVLAAIIATPCTGPFMAAALGAALLLPILQALTLFIALGFGLALPYLAIAYIPALRHRLPKPGAWMSRFRKVMAIPMMLTAVALAWLLWRLSGLSGLMIGMGAAILLLIIFITIRRKQHSGQSAVMPVVAAAIITIAAALMLPKNAITRGHDTSAETTLPSEPYSAAKLAEYRGEGRGVFVYFTADWCITCKINEAAAIQRQSTVDAFAKNNIAVLRADFTRKDPEMARILQSYGSAGVPLYLWFAPGKESEIMPQLLTPSMLAALK